MWNLKVKISHQGQRFENLKSIENKYSIYYSGEKAIMDYVKIER